MSVASTILLAATASFGQRFGSIEDLGIGKAHGVNNLGEVCGYLNPAGQHLGFIYRDRAPQIYDNQFHDTSSEFFQVITGGPSGTRLAVGFEHLDTLPGSPEKAVLAVLQPNNTYQEIRLGNSDFAPNRYLYNASISPSHYPYLYYNAPSASSGSLLGASHAYGIVKAASDLPGLDGLGQPASFDVYYVVGDYEYSVSPRVTHAALWRVTINTDSYGSLSNYEAILFDLHPTSTSIIDGGVQLWDMAGESSCARAITRFSTKARGITQSSCVIGGALTTDAKRAARWDLSADISLDAVPPCYYTAAVPSLWNEGTCRALYYRYDKDKIDQPIIGYFAGSGSTQGTFMANGAQPAPVAGVLNGLGLTGVDRGEVWAVGTSTQAFLYQPTNGGTLTLLDSFLPNDSGWATLSEADAISGKVVVGSGTMADNQIHAYKLTLR